MLFSCELKVLCLSLNSRFDNEGRGQSERSNKKYEKSQSSQQMLSIPKHLISKKIPLVYRKKNVIGATCANLFSGQLIF